MEFDIGNILYIVITLVAVIVGILGKKKKPAREGADDAGSENRPGFMENLERVLRMGQEDPAITNLQEHEADMIIKDPELIIDPVINVATPSKSIMDDYDRIMSSNRQMDMDILRAGEGESMIESLEAIDLEHEGRINFFDIVNDFDAGTAVVYSAIINRIEY